MTEEKKEPKMIRCYEDMSSFAQVHFRAEAVDYEKLRQYLELFPQDDVCRNALLNIEEQKKIVEKRGEIIDRLREEMDALQTETQILKNRANKLDHQTIELTKERYRWVIKNKELRRVAKERQTEKIEAKCENEKLKEQINVAGLALVELQKDAEEYHRLKSVLSAESTARINAQSDAEKLRKGYAESQNEIDKLKKENFKFAEHNLAVENKKLRSIFEDMKRECFTLGEKNTQLGNELFESEKHHFEIFDGLREALELDFDDDVCLTAFRLLTDRKENLKTIWGDNEKLVHTCNNRLSQIEGLKNELETSRSQIKYLEGDLESLKGVRCLNHQHLCSQQDVIENNIDAIRNRDLKIESQLETIEKLEFNLKSTTKLNSEKHRRIQQNAETINGLHNRVVERGERINSLIESNNLLLVKTGKYLGIIEKHEKDYDKACFEIGRLQEKNQEIYLKGIHVRIRGDESDRKMDESRKTVNISDERQIIKMQAIARLPFEKQLEQLKAMNFKKEK